MCLAVDKHISDLQQVLGRRGSKLLALYKKGSNCNGPACGLSGEDFYIPSFKIHAYIHAGRNMQSMEKGEKSEKLDLPSGILGLHFLLFGFHLA